MNILLVNPRMCAASQPPLGLAYISAYLKANGYGGVEVIDTTWDDLGKRAAELPFVPDVIGIQTMTPYFTRSMKAAESLRARFPSAKLVVGGPHPSVDPEQTASVLAPDIGVVGEGEVTMLEIVRALEAGGDAAGLAGTFRGTPGADYALEPARPLVEDLDEIPFPDRDALPMHQYLRRGIMQEFGFKALRATTILTTRGCPFGCIYCSRFLGRKVRHRSPENVIAEVTSLVDAYAIDGLFIVDDTFTVDRAWTEQVCELLQRQPYRLELAINSRVDIIDAGFLATLKAAGVCSIAFGVESGNPEILKSLRKGITLDQVEEAVRRAREAGIRVKGYFMIGSPGETLETMRQSVELARRLPFDQVQFSIATPYPGTKLWEIAAERNLVNDFAQALDRGFAEAGVMSTGTLSPAEVKKFHEDACMPLVYRRIVTSVLRDWRSTPYFLAYVVRRMQRRRHDAARSVGGGDVDTG